MPETVLSLPGATVFQAPAKINLALHITGRRTDGYHLIESLVVFTRFGDRVTAALAEDDQVTISGRYAPGLAIDGGNLIVKARDALRSHIGPANAPPVILTLEKNLPVASGVGGGSSDAAAALRALCRIWGTAVDERDLACLGLSLGADLPMCLAAKPLIARGVGETLVPVANFPALGLVLVNPGTAVSTADVFERLGSRDNPALPPLPAHIDFHSLRNWLETTRNDLEAPARAIEPAIGAAARALDRAGSGFTRMSGSGATCFGLFETGNVAKRAAAEIRRRHPEWFVAATRSISSEASHGED